MSKLTSLLFIGDVMRGDQCKNVLRMQEIFYPIIKRYNLKSELFVSDCNRIEDLEKWLPIWKNSLLSDEASALRNIKFDKQTAIVGFELSSKDQLYLTNKNIPWINFRIHPLRFLNDLQFDVQTSFDFKFDKHITKTEEIYGQIMNLRSRYVKLKSDEVYGGKNIAIFGQTPFDRSVFYSGKFKRLDDYISALDIITKDFDTVFYKPHPYMTNAVVDNLIIERYSAKTVFQTDVYAFLFSDNLGAACSISSSLLYEAPYFGLKSIFLEQPNYKFGSPIDFKSLLTDGVFWSKFLRLHNAFDGPNEVVVYPLGPNYIRNVFQSYWGYKHGENVLLSGREQVGLLNEGAGVAFPAEAEARAQAAEVEARAQAAEARAQAAEAEARAEEEEVKRYGTLFLTIKELINDFIIINQKSLTSMQNIESICIKNYLDKNVKDEKINPEIKKEIRINRIDVIYAYQHFLQRLPENDEVVSDKLRLMNFTNLVNNIKNSEEFIIKNIERVDTKQYFTQRIGERKKFRELDRIDVIYAYQHFLQRLPENDEVINQKLNHKNVKELLNEFKKSDEYRNKYSQIKNHNKKKFINTCIKFILINKKQKVHYSLNRLVFKKNGKMRDFFRNLFVKNDISIPVRKTIPFYTSYPNGKYNYDEIIEMDVTKNNTSFDKVRDIVDSVSEKNLTPREKQILTLLKGDFGNANCN